MEPSKPIPDGEIPFIVAALRERILCARKGPLYHDKTESNRSFPTEADSSGRIREFPWTFHDHELMVDAINALPSILATIDALVAERDALRERVEGAEVAARVCREDAEINASRAEKAERERDGAHRASMTAAEDFANATGRVCQSNVELRALLGNARKCVAIVNANGYYDAWLARCDALLDTPTDDDTRGDGRDEGGKQNA